MMKRTNLVQALILASLIGVGAAHAQTNSDSNSTSNNSASPTTAPGESTSTSNSPSQNNEGQPAVANPAMPSDASFKKLDLNGDGFIDSAEAQKDRSMGGWRSYDTNGDGRVSASEFSARPAGTRSTK